jgi:hypothetical protein
MREWIVLWSTLLNLGLLQKKLFSLSNREIARVADRVRQMPCPFSGLILAEISTRQYSFDRLLAVAPRWLLDRFGSGLKQWSKELLYVLRSTLLNFGLLMQNVFRPRTTPLIRLSEHSRLRPWKMHCAPLGRLVRNPRTTLHLIAYLRIYSANPS